MSDLIKILQIADVVKKDIKSFLDWTHEYCSSNEFHIVQVYGDFKICYNTMTCYVTSNGYNNECLKIRKYSRNVLSNYKSNNMVLYYNEKNEYPDFLEVTPDAYFNYVLENTCIFTYDELKFIKNMDNSNSIPNTTMIYKVNSLFWDQNEKMCLRQINVYDLDRQIAVLNSTKHDGKWTCTFVPMGYKFSTDEMVNLSSCVSKSIVLMKVLELDTVTLDEVQENIDNV